MKGVAAVLLQQTCGKQQGKRMTANLLAILLRKRATTKFTPMILKLSFSLEQVFFHFFDRLV